MALAVRAAYSREGMFVHGRKEAPRRGEGSIRQRKDGTWEARFVTGIDPGTGKEIRKSVYAKTQKEVRMKMTEAVAALDNLEYSIEF